MDFFATLEAAFGVAAFDDFLAVALAVFAALAGADFDAAAFRPGTFLAMVLIAVFATGEILLIDCKPVSPLMGRVYAAYN